MTTAQLAGRIQIDQSRITRLEAAEVDGSITLKKLRQVAEGLDCTLIYALVPNQPLDNILRQRAGEIVDRQLARTHHTMKLENQALTARDLQTERTRLIETAMTGSPRRLWDEP